MKIGGYVWSIEYIGEGTRPLTLGHFDARDNFDYRLRFDSFPAGLSR